MQVTDEMVEAALANLPNRHLMNKTGVRAALTAALAEQTQQGVEVLPLWCESCGEAEQAVHLDHAGLCSDCAKQQEGE